MWAEQTERSSVRTSRRTGISTSWEERSTHWESCQDRVRPPGPWQCTAILRRAPLLCEPMPIRIGGDGASMGVSRISTLDAQSIQRVEKVPSRVRGAAVPRHQASGQRLSSPGAHPDAVGARLQCAWVQDRPARGPGRRAPRAPCAHAPGAPACARASAGGRREEACRAPCSGHAPGVVVPAGLQDFYLSSRLALHGQLHWAFAEYTEAYGITGPPSIDGSVHAPGWVLGAGVSYTF